MQLVKQLASKWTVRDLLIATTIFLGTVYTCLYISISQERVRNKRQSSINTALDTGEASDVDTREEVLDARTTTFTSKDHSKSDRNDDKGQSANTMNVNIHLNMSDVSGTVSEILYLLKRTLVHNEAVVNEENDNHSPKTNKQINTINFRSKDIMDPKYLLTLFSTWEAAAENKNIHKNTIRNWANFKPAVNVILFSDDVDDAKECMDLGWKVMKIPSKAETLPVLKHMFIKAMEVSDSYFYGYANSDILFTDGLLHTLLTLTYNMRDMFVTKPIFMTGNRWNVANVTEKEIVPRRNIENIIKERGNFFMTSAEEYFITSYNYPWTEIPELVVGVVAFDNWLVMNARIRGHVTTDTTRTIIALHQDLDTSYYKSHFRNVSAHNEILLKSLYPGEIPFEKGFANCIELFTESNNDVIVVNKREIEDYCKV